ncbi:rhodopsin-like orphan GPCR [Schistosoma japonicum]|uniref:Rhodopsin-like orphan GPCR n=1 Tax=Schistosoma japonicum TaxID=6182 RepID=A0A4Z2D7Q7_SCHJA|nr:rhodopsin-like orphan GPCR [Schistosoma japonicum]
MEGVWMLLKIWFKIDIRDYNDWLCIFHTSFSNYLFYWSAYMQCLLSVQRCYLVLYPLEVKSKWMSLSKLFIYQGIISILLIMPILPYPLYWQVINGDCDPVNDRIFRLTTLCDLIFWGFIPIFVMTTCTGVICRNLVSRHKFVRGPIQSRMKCNQQDNHSNSLHIKYSIDNLCKQKYQVKSQLHMNSEMRLSRSEIILSNQQSTSMNDLRTTPELYRRNYVIQDSYKQVTPLLLCMNFVYMASVFPLLIYFLYLNFIIDHIDNNMHKFLYYLFRSFCLLNTCTNWIFYCVAGKKFRDHTKQLLLSICNSKKSTSTINEYGFLIIKFANKRRCSVTNVTRTRELVSIHKKTISMS